MRFQNESVAEFYGQRAPDRWQVVPAKRFCREVDQRSSTGEEELLGLSKATGVRRKSDMDQRASEAENYAGYKTVAKGDLISNKMQAWNGMFGISPYDGITSPDYAIYRLKSTVNHRFIEYVCRTDLYAKEFHAKSRGMGTGFLRLNQSEFLSTPFILPDLATQRQIADFLDRETARIDLLIEKKQRLVALLGEKEKAKKLDLVTGQRRGEQKETSILWAPSIPKHWEERAVWMLFELGRGRVMSHEYIAENEGEYPIYSSQTANDGVMGYINTYDFEGDYLTWTTDGAKAGTVFRRRGKFNCTNVCGTLRPLTRSIDLNYAQVALDTATDFFVRHDINPKLMNGVMAKIRIPYPPLDEQRKVGEAIDQIEQSYKPILEKNQTSIDRLKEYRSALITAAVTGQIDVSTYATSGATDRRLDTIQEEMGA